MHRPVAEKAFQIFCQIMNLMEKTLTPDLHTREVGSARFNGSDRHHG